MAPGRMRLRRVAGALLVSVALAGCGSDAGGLDAAIDIADDDAAFGTGPEAGESFARIAQHVDAARADCDDDTDGTRCDALAAASGYAQVLAVRVLTCTAPGRFEARTAMLDLLEAVESLGPDADEPPEPAPLPDCT